MGKLLEAHLGAFSKGHELTAQADLRFEVYLSLCHMVVFCCVFFFFTPPLGLELEIQVGEM